jgi:hypothetical protein
MGAQPDLLRLASHLQRGPLLSWQPLDFTNGTILEHKSRTINSSSCTITASHQTIRKKGEPAWRREVLPYAVNRSDVAIRAGNQRQSSTG